MGSDGAFLLRLFPVYALLYCIISVQATGDCLPAHRNNITFTPPCCEKSQHELWREKNVGRNHKL